MVNINILMALYIREILLMEKNKGMASFRIRRKGLYLRVSLGMGKSWEKGF